MVGKWRTFNQSGKEPMAPTADASSISTEATSTHTARLQPILDLQRRAFLREGPPTAAKRHDRVDRLILLLTQHADAFAEAMNADFGNRPAAASLIADVAGVLPDLLMTRKR